MQLPIITEHFGFTSSMGQTTRKTESELEEGENPKIVFVNTGMTADLSSKERKIT
jgi:hypothetical protein